MDKNLHLFNAKNIKNAQTLLSRICQHHSLEISWLLSIFLMLAKWVVQISMSLFTTLRTLNSSTPWISSSEMTCFASMTLTNSSKRSLWIGPRPTSSTRIRTREMWSSTSTWISRGCPPEAHLWKLVTTTLMQRMMVLYMELLEQ